jgi:hypothetical protein
MFVFEHPQPGRIPVVHQLAEALGAVVDVAGGWAPRKSSSATAATARAEASRSSCRALRTITARSFLQPLT